MEMVIKIDALGHTTGEVNIDECASPLSAGLLTYQQNLDRSVYNSCYLAPVRWRHFRKRGHISKNKKNMEENSSRTAPSSTDACNSIVHALMCRRQGGNWADIHIYFFSLFVLLEFLCTF